MNTAVLLDGCLRNGDQFANILRRGVPKIHHDVGVDVRDLGIAVAEALEPTLIDESPRPYAFHLLEDRSGARVPLEPGMPASTPAQILLENALERALIGARELERGREHDVATMMKNGVV